MAFEAIKEDLRQSRLAGKDSNFYKNLTYFFELIVPKSQVQNRSPNFLFPLLLAPEQYTLTENFSMGKTFTQGSGLFVEENGILERTIHIQGHTGFKPRKFKGSTGFSSIKAPSAGRSHTREIIAPIEELSGQKHFHFLQDAVFRTYGDLKRDPATSEATRLLFHNVRESEHWEVKPVTFRLTRELESRNLYRFDIELLVVGPGEDVAKGESEDKPLIDTLREGLSMIQSGIDMIRAAAQDLVAIANEIERTIKGVATLIKGALAIADTASDFVTGVAEVIAAPFQAIANTTNALTDVLQKMVDSVRTFPDFVYNAWRQMQDGFDRLGSFPQYFLTSSQRQLQSVQSGAITQTTAAALQEAAAEAPPNSFQKVIAKGTGLMSGDLLRSRANILDVSELTEYQSATEYKLGATDSLQSLAARYLGDARLWRHIAILNSLQHPFISREGIPGTKRIGDTILLPSRNRPPELQEITPVLGVSPDASVEERVLGTDLAMERVDGPGDLFDLVIDVEGGSVDVKVVSGVENLSQALLARLRTERGTDHLYKEVGVDRIIGVGIPAVGPQIVATRISQAVRADPRIAAVRSVDLEQPAPDTVDVNLTAEVIGISGTTPVNLRL